MLESLRRKASLLFVLAPLASLALASPLAAEEVSVSKAKTFARQMDLFLRGERRESLRDFIAEMGTLDDPRTVVLIPPAATILPDAANFAAARRVISELAGEKSVAALIGILEKTKSIDFRQQVLILEGFSLRADDATLRAITSALKSPISHVQVAAAHAARARKSRVPVPALIDLLEEHWKLRDRAYLEAHSALIVLTGQSFESIEDWRKFWEGAKDTLDPANLGKEEGTTQVTVKTTEDSIEFFGSEIFSRNLVFVIDVSGSMAMFDDGNPSEPRLKRAMEQLTKALEKVPDGALFNVIAYSNSVKPWQRQMQPSTKSTRAAAIKFVSAFKPLEATHTDEALEKAFEDLRVDTIVLLSDGAPVKREQPRSEALIEKITKWFRDINSGRRVRIDTFGFERIGEWPDNLKGRMPPPPTPQELKLFVEFLQTLAKESGGVYRAI
jgi:hypothetical protein